MAVYEGARQRTIVLPRRPRAEVAPPKRAAAPPDPVGRPRAPRPVADLGAAGRDHRGVRGRVLLTVPGHPGLRHRLRAGPPRQRAAPPRRQGRGPPERARTAWARRRRSASRRSTPASARFPSRSSSRPARGPVDRCWGGPTLDSARSSCCSCSWWWRGSLGVRLAYWQVLRRDELSAMATEQSSTRYELRGERGVDLRPDRHRRARDERRRATGWRPTPGPARPRRDAPRSPRTWSRCWASRARPPTS